MSEKISKTTQTTTEMPSFDHMLKLAEENPEELEKLRLELAKNTIESASEDFRPRLRGLQFQIDSARKLSKSPLSACISISEMMHESFGELRNLLNGAANPELVTVSETESPQSADIIPFRTR